MTDLPYDLILDLTPEEDDGRAHYDIGVMFDRQPGKAAHLRIDSDPGVETTENPVYGPNLIFGMGQSERYEPGSYGWGENIDTLTPDVILPGGKVTQLNITAGSNIRPFRSSVKFGNNLFFFGGRYPVAVSGGFATEGTFTVDLGSDNVMTEISGSVIWDGKIILGTSGVSTGTVGSMWITADGVTWTEYTAANLKARKFKKVAWDTNGQFAFRLIRMQDLESFSTLDAGASPTTAGDWSGTTQLEGIADVGVGCLSIAASPTHVWFCAATGVWDVDSRRGPRNLTPFFEDSYVVSNGGASMFYDGAVHVNYGNGIVRVPVNGSLNQVPEHYAPGYGTANGTPISGYAAPPCAWNGWIIWPIYNPGTGQSHIMMARHNGERWIWHGSYATFDGIITHTRVDSPLSGQTRLWVCTEGSTMDIYSVSLPFSGSAYQELRNGGSHRFAETGSIFFPDGWNAPTSRRTQYRATVYADRLDGVAQVGVYASRDHEDYEKQGDATSSPRTSFIPQTIENPSFRLDYRLDLQGTDSNPPVLRAFQPYADVNREQIPIWSVRLKLADSKATHNGNDTQDPAIVRDLLWNLQSEMATPIRVQNKHGDIMVCQVLPTESLDVRDNHNNQDETTVTLRLRELWLEWHWDSGVTWDSGRFWS